MTHLCCQHQCVNGLDLNILAPRQVKEIYNNRSSSIYKNQELEFQVNKVLLHVQIYCT